MSDVPPKHLHVVTAQEARSGVVIDEFKKIDEFIMEVIREYRRLEDGVRKCLSGQGKNSPHRDEHTDPDGLIKSIQPHQLAIFNKKEVLEDQSEEREELVALIVQYYREGNRNVFNEKEIRNRIAMIVSITPFDELSDIINTTNALLKKVVAVG